jgi:hypothetical protein
MASRGVLGQRPQADRGLRRVWAAQILAESARAQGSAADQCAPNPQGQILQVGAVLRVDNLDLRLFARISQSFVSSRLSRMSSGGGRSLADPGEKGLATAVDSLP